MVDSWNQLGIRYTDNFFEQELTDIRPYEHLICQTPPFRLLLGITEYLFKNDELLNEAIKAAIYDKEIRADDCEFNSAAKGWAEFIALGSPDAYRARFQETANFFQDRVPHAKQISAKMIEMIAQKTHP